MGDCLQCGIEGDYTRINHEGLCRECEEENAAELERAGDAARAIAAAEIDFSPESGLQNIDAGKQ